MKKIIEFLSPKNAGTIIMLLVIILACVTGTFAQETQSVTGKLVEYKTRQAIPYATVALIRVADSAMTDGAMSDENGMFTISALLPGNYRLRVSGIGYETLIRDIQVIKGVIADAGVIDLQETDIQLKELEILGERVKAKSEGDKTTFFMTGKMLDASSNGLDVIKLIPGIQVDLMQKISLEGNEGVQVLVDGKERDAGFISQLDPKQIDRVELISIPSSDLDGSATGAINIILKKEKDSGLNGQITAEIPTSFSEIYLRPGYSLNWEYKKLDIYTSYKGELTYLDLHESTCRRIMDSAGRKEITTDQSVRQKDWSHRFTFGIDYLLNSRNQLNFYGFYNPGSRELDGDAGSQVSGSSSSGWQAKREDSDRNTRTFYSLYYKHDFKNEGSTISMEISNYHMNSKSSTEYLPEGDAGSLPVQTNAADPVQNVTILKSDFSARLWKKLDFSTGVKARVQVLHDDLVSDFYYDEKIFAAYGTLSYTHPKYFFSLGLRAEESFVNLKDRFINHDLSFFPSATFNYKLTSRQNIQLSCSRSILRPNIYQLNPNTASDDPYSVNKGNPFLEPEYRTSLFLEYSIRFQNNYLASRLFYNKLNSVINNLTFINDTGAIETKVQNLGVIHEYGVQFSGTFRMGIVTINPFLQLFNLTTSGNDLARQNGIQNRHDLEYNSGLSAILSFRHDISCSFVFQYASPKNNIQGNSFCGALYFLSVEKTFMKKIKAGLVCALPFTDSFTYQGSEIHGSGFYSHYEGNVKISNPFCWVKLSYQFRTGKKKEMIEHATEEIENLPKKGF